MTIYAVTLSGRRAAMATSATEDVYSIKTKISRQENIPVDLMVLTFGTVTLQNERSLGDYNICHGDVIGVSLLDADAGGCPSWLGCELRPKATTRLGHCLGQAAFRCLVLLVQRCLCSVA